MATLLTGLVLSSVLAGLMQKRSNMFYEVPRFSVFMLLSIFHFAYCLFTHVLFNRLLLQKAH